MWNICCSRLEKIVKTDSSGSENMLHVILVILKIAGLVLAVLLSLLILAVCAVLFVPLRYRIHAVKDADKMVVEGKAGWLLQAVSLHFAYRERKCTVKIRILFFRKSILPADEKIPSGHRTEKEYSAGLQKKNEETVARKQSTDHDLAGSRSEKKISEDHSGEQADIRSMHTGEKAHGQTTEKKEPEEKKNGKRIQNLKEKIQNIFCKGSALKERMQETVSALKEDAAKNVFRRFRHHLAYLWKHLKPDRIRGELKYGFNDPSLTGELTGILYLLLPAGHYQIRLEPDFENAVYEGDLSIRGHIRICHLVRIVACVFFDKEFRALLKRFQNKR